MPQIFLVDAFAHAPFTGNPAAVCPLSSEPDEGWMQSVAMEMNQAETAFFWPRSDGYGLRWFTPAIEVDLCGHATLASAHILYTEFGLTGPARFHTKSGELVCTRTSEGIEMDFPDESPTETDVPGAEAALGARPVWTGANRMDWFVTLETEDLVRSLSPDREKVYALGKRGVIVTAQVNPNRSEPTRADFLSRFFAPQSGIDEDPVTGSAHCALGPYWSSKLGKPIVTGYQASKRGGFVQVTPNGPRVNLRGQALTTLHGELRV